MVEAVVSTLSLPLLYIGWKSMSSILPSAGCREVQQKWICLPKSESYMSLLYQVMEGH